MRLFVFINLFCTSSQLFVCDSFSFANLIKHRVSVCIGLSGLIDVLQSWMVLRISMQEIFELFAVKITRRLADNAELNSIFSSWIVFKAELWLRGNVMVLISIALPNWVIQAFSFSGDSAKWFHLSWIFVLIFIFSPCWNRWWEKKRGKRLSVARCFLRR